MSPFLSVCCIFSKYFTLLFINIEITDKLDNDKSISVKIHLKRMQKNANVLVSLRTFTLHSKKSIILVNNFSQTINLQTNCTDFEEN